MPAMSAQRAIAQLGIRSEGREWRVTVGDGAAPPVEARAELALPALSLPRLPVMVAGSDASMARAENAFAQALVEALSGATSAWAHLQLLRGRSEAAGAPLVVVVDTDTPEVEWELMSLGDGPLEASGSGVVVRWAHGSSAPRSASPTAAVWLATDDPASIAVADAARASLAAAGLELVGVDERPSVLWLVAHGTPGQQALEVAMGRGAASAAAVSANLAGALEAATLAVVAVCHGGAARASRHDALVGSLLAAGVPAVLAPATAVPVELLLHLAEGLGGGLGRGESLARAHASARRHVRAWAFPHPTARWTAMRCHVCAIDVLDTVLRPVGWAPDGWPQPDAAASAWLEAARADAERRSDGYVGVEHLLRTLAAAAAGGPVTAALRRAAAEHLRPYEAASASLLPQRGHAALEVTPRLERVGRGLGSAFGLDALASCVMGELAAPPVLEPAAFGVETLESVAHPHTGPIDVEVLGGPEDGRRLTPTPGATIGRAGGDADIALYTSSRLTDRKLSRRHLTWRGDTLDSVRPFQVEGPEGPRDPRLPLRPGDVVEVTRATRLRAVRRD